MKLIEAELNPIVSKNLGVPVTVAVSWTAGPMVWKSDLGPGGFTVVGWVHGIWFLSRKRPGNMTTREVIARLGYGASRKAVIID